MLGCAAGKGSRLALIDQPLRQPSKSPIGLACDSAWRTVKDRRSLLNIQIAPESQQQDRTLPWAQPVQFTDEVDSIFDRIFRDRRFG